jgi:hypothetical protein
MIYLLIFRGGRNEINTFWYCDNRGTAFGLDARADFFDAGDDCEAACAAVERTLEEKRGNPE